MHLRSPDAITLAALPLVVVAFWAGGLILPTTCLCLAGAIVVYAIAGHEEVAWKQRVAVCGLVAILDLAVVSYLYKLNLAEERRQQVAPLVAAALPSPVSSNCPIPRGAVALYLGNTVSVVTEICCSFGGLLAPNILRNLVESFPIAVTLFGTHARLLRSHRNEGCVKNWNSTSKFLHDSVRGGLPALSSRIAYTTLQQLG